MQLRPSSRTRPRATPVTAAVTEQVDVVLNLAPVAPAQLAAFVTLVRPGGAVDGFNYTRGRRVALRVWRTAAAP